MAHLSRFILLIALVPGLVLARSVPAPRPSDFHLGLPQRDSQLVSTERFRSNETEAVYVVYTTQRIDYVVARDQSADVGGPSSSATYVRRYVGGIRQRFVELHFARRPTVDAAATAEIDYVIEVWAAPTVGPAAVMAADLVQGERREGAIFHVLDVEMEGKPGEQLDSGKYWVAHSARYITYIRTFDLTGSGTGGVLTLQEAVNNTAMYMLVDSVRPGLGVHFRIYMETLPEEEDEPAGTTFVQGAWRPEMELLDEREIAAANKWQDLSITRTLEFSDPHAVIGAIVGLDFSDQNSGHVRVVSGGVGHSAVVLRYESGVGASLASTLEIYGTRR